MNWKINSSKILKRKKNIQKHYFIVLEFIRRMKFLTQPLASAKCTARIFSKNCQKFRTVWSETIVIKEEEQQKQFYKERRKQLY